MVEGTPPGDALRPPPQEATPARKGARCGAGAGSPRPHQPHPGHTGRGAPAARSRRPGAGGGTAPDTRRPSQRRPARAQCCVPTPAPTAPVEGTPPGDALPPPPQRATPARKGARCGAGAGSPRPHRPHPGHTGRRNPATRPKGRTPAGGGTAPDTRRPSQRWQAIPPGDGPPPPPRHAAPTGHAGQGDSVGPPHPHARAHSTWVADPNSPPSWRAVGGGTAPDLRRPSQMVEGTPPGDASPPPPQRATPARKGARCGARAGFQRPHRPQPGHTGRGTLAARSRGPAAGGGTVPDTRRPSQWWKAPPPGTATHHPRSTQPPQGMQAKGTVLGPHTHTPAPTACGWRTPTTPPVGGQFREGERLTTDAPHNGGRHPPGTPFRHPHSEQRRPARAHAVGPVLIPMPAPTAPGTHRSRYPGCPPHRAAGGGTAPDTRRPSQRWQATPPHPGQPPQGMQAKLGPHTHTPVAHRNPGYSPPPDLKGTPPGDALPPPPQRATPARKGARCGAGAGSSRPHRPHPGHTGRGTPAARSRGWAAGVGTASDTRRPSQRWQSTPPRGRPPTTPATSSPHRACRPRGQCRAPTPTHPRPQHVGGGPQQPAQWAGSPGRDSA